jgi:hypothetical protein
MPALVQLRAMCHRQRASGPSVTPASIVAAGEDQKTQAGQDKEHGHA